MTEDDTPLPSHKQIRDPMGDSGLLPFSSTPTVELPVRVVGPVQREFKQQFSESTVEFIDELLKLRKLDGFTSDVSIIGEPTPIVIVTRSVFTSGPHC